MGTPYTNLFRQVEETDPVLEPSGGGYFIAPKGVLDERLFDNDVMRADVRAELLGMLHDFWRQRYAEPESWSHVWIAGSQITPQWREEGDLDVLIGLDMARFFAANPAFKGFGEALVSKHLNKELKAELWPRTENWRGWAEVTWYVNPKTGSDIRTIKPYAAYSLSKDEWSVAPPDLPADWGEHDIPATWQRTVGAEIERAKALVDRYNQGKAELSQYRESSPGWLNAMHRLKLVIDAGKELFESIHGDRRQAFQGEFGVGGKGFFDYYNYRWQAHKKAGTVKALSMLKNAAVEAERLRLEDRYGGEISTVLSPGSLPRGY